ncbi:FR47 domain-containing protein [Mollisia scopiformis]|uniref:FR47 domain-containing protein n=1 Tax=Mollisia scopiformis TaxID=149040 RepID=A0A194WVA3_MOLSC|nr:FR47 domain-containing protein [Mollisia scopiformis]KUJ11522.1 FR47 domain-containing protein [Mollisia scopiformis]
MDLQIRKATLQDAPGIARVHVLAWQEAYHGIVPQPYLASLDIAARTEIWKSRLDQSTIEVFVAILDNQICGFASGGPAREPIHGFDGEFHAIYLFQTAKGKGIGRLLMRRVAEALQARGFSRAMLWVLKDNSSRGFYERLSGKEFAQKIDSIGGANLVEVAYGWEDLQVF